MMKIGILGADGFLGKALCKQFPDAVQITHDNYVSHAGTEFDIFINANGNSRKYHAEKNPFNDFNKSVISVMDTLGMFIIKHYIYISSLYADYRSQSTYGFHKYLAEEIVRHNADSYLNLRCCAMIGKDMKKGVIYDLLKSKRLWITGESSMQFITVSEVAKIIETCIKKKFTYPYFTNVCGNDMIRISEVAEMLGVEFKERKNAIRSILTYTGEYHLPEIFPIKTSKQYIQEFIDERMEQSV